MQYKSPKIKKTIHAKMDEDCHVGKDLAFCATSLLKHFVGLKQINPDVA